MSVTPQTRPPLPADITALKGQRPIVVLTAYTTPMARLVDRHCDVAMIGDSLGMVIHGLPSTVGVTLEMMVLHGRAVMRGLTRAMAVIDLPFGAYEAGPQAAFAAASHLMKETGVPGVKLEGGVRMADTIRFLVDRGVPVMAHIGLTPQSFTTLGGYRVVGRDAEGEALMADARAVADAGAYAVVLEKVPAPLAARITGAIPIPTIGIGAGVDCDGQVLVVDDMLGMFTDFRPKFVRRYAELAATADAAIGTYAEDVRARRFPGPEHSFAAAAPKP
jgi:3-methyl-2-oxobutanoate hydroxymethyltransferase